MTGDLLQSRPEGQLLIYMDGGLNIQVHLDSRTVWLNQRLMAEFYQVSIKTVNEYLKNIYTEGELDPEATIRNFRIVQTEGLVRFHVWLSIIISMPYWLWATVSVLHEALHSVSGQLHAAALIY